MYILRFFIVPSTGAAILLMNEVNRDNFGLTIDFGHCLMAGNTYIIRMISITRNNENNVHIS